MKRNMILLLVLALIALNPTAGECQEVGSGLTFGGGFVFDNEPTFAAFGGAEFPFLTDTVRGLQLFNRTVYHQVRRDESREVQAASTWAMARYAIVDNFSVAGGAGYQTAVKEGNDDNSIGLKAEVGYLAWKRLNFFLGYEWKQAEEIADDKTFLYLGLTVVPKVR